MAALPITAPVLSTPDTHMFNDTTIPSGDVQRQRFSDEHLAIRYELERTINEIKEKRWRRVALQFPDDMLPDSAKVYQLLARGLSPSRPSPGMTARNDTGMNGRVKKTASVALEDQKPVKLTILGDTSYGSCCVDEIAAEHVDADAVIHYGRACLSPTARLPVLHVFTKRDLDYTAVAKAFLDVYPDHNTKIILTADVTYANHIEPVHGVLSKMGYSNIFPATIILDPSSPIPNRKIPGSVRIHAAELLSYQLFHISSPPTSLLLTLSSRVHSVHIHPTNSPSAPFTASTPALLRRRYALVTSLSSIPTWGILINTLSVSNYLSMVTHVQSEIEKAGKKSYLVVVGKLNAAKIANFSEVGGWVVIGCWESSLIDSKDFYAPVITPFELQLALQSDGERLWSGAWRGDWKGVLDGQGEENGEESDDKRQEEEERASDDESAPPEFDLRTGRYVSHSRPLASSQKQGRLPQSSALTKRVNGDIATANSIASSAAEFLRSQRTWQGLGSDIEIRYDEDMEGAVMQEGRSGTARGYTVGESKRT